MVRLSVLAVVAIVLAVAGVGLAVPPLPAPQFYALVDANGGRAPTFVEQQNMSSVRRVALGRYCLLAALSFDQRTIGQVTVDSGLSGGRPGLATIVTTSKLCRAPELAVATYRFTPRGP